MKKRKNKISQREIERRKMQAKIWHKATHPNEEYELAEKRRRENFNKKSDNDALLFLN
jgi:hypothetical protein